MATAGTVSCTMKGISEAYEFTKTGPDGVGWVELDAAALKAFCAGAGQKLYHQRLAEHAAKHVCALFGTWGFTAGDTTRSVVFLRYEFKGGLAAAAPGDVFDPTTMVGVFGHDLYKDYVKVGKTRAAHVWQRAAHGEIAVDFCVG